MRGVYEPAYLRDLLGRARTIAVVGASADTWRPSNGITRYLMRAGYRVRPVNPTIAGTNLHGERVLASLAEVEEPIYLVNVFRRSDAVSEVVEDAIRVHAPAIWFQLGIHNEDAARRAEEAGLKVVMNRCISVEHSRLMH